MTSQSVTRFAYILICDMYALPLLLSVLHVCLCFICLLMLNILFFYATMYEYMSKRPHFFIAKTSHLICFPTQTMISCAISCNSRFVQ